VRIVEEGALRPLIFLSRFPDTEIQRYASLAFAGLALGGQGKNKSRIVEEGAMRPLSELLRFPDRKVQLSALVAINCVTLGEEKQTKSAVMSENGLEAIIQLADIDGVDGESVDLISTAIYALGTLSEHEDVRAKLVDLNAIPVVVKQLLAGSVDIKRAAGYFLGTMCEQVEFHPDLDRAGALDAIIRLAVMEDIECQEYAAFSLAHLSSNKDYQVRLVQLGVVKPLVAILASDNEPKHYAGLALLKLADNFENHLRIAEEGGIQALLRLGRTRTTDEQLQYKAALTVGQLASNAVKLIPNREQAAGITVQEGKMGHGANMLTKLRSAANTNSNSKGKDLTVGYLDKSLKDEEDKNAKTAGQEYSQRVTRTALSINAHSKSTPDLNGASGGGEK
jgi:hypothetical protein